MIAASDQQPTQPAHDGNGNGAGQESWGGQASGGPDSYAAAEPAIQLDDTEFGKY